MSFQSFDDYFKSQSIKAFQEMAEMNIPSYEELILIYGGSKKLLDDFLKLKNPPNMPPLTDNFKQYFIENLTNGYAKHCPIYYSTQNGMNSLRYASPELLNLIWINMKSCIVWYNSLIRDGYFIDQ
jgi:hypothetical protein